MVRCGIIALLLTVAAAVPTMADQPAPATLEQRAQDSTEFAAVSQSAIGTKQDHAERSRRSDRLLYFLTGVGLAALLIVITQAGKAGARAPSIPVSAATEVLTSAPAAPGVHTPIASSSTTAREETTHDAVAETQLTVAQLTAELDQMLAMFPVEERKQASGGGLQLPAADDLLQRIKRICGQLPDDSAIGENQLESIWFKIGELHKWLAMLRIRERGAEERPALPGERRPQEPT
jgi:hypothetical protein